MQLTQRPHARKPHAHPPHAHTHVFHDWTAQDGVHKEFDWAASGWAGLAGGGALLVWEMALAPLFLGISPAEMVRRVAAIALGESAVRLTAFTTMVGLTAAIVHLPLSLIYARLLGAIVHRMRARAAVLFGAAFGAALYAVNFYGFTSVFPWFVGLRGWPTLLGHVVFGVVAAATYEGLLNAKD
jgi:hypothetical protein